MERDQLSARLQALGHVQRQAVLRLLMRHLPGELPAGTIARDLGLKASTLSVYLSALSRAGLVTARREGPERRYRACPEALEQIMCGIAGQVAEGRLARGSARRTAPWQVLFLEGEAGGAGPIAAAVLQRYGMARFHASVGGLSPLREVDPVVAQVLTRMGHDVSGLIPMGPGQAADIVVTLDATAASFDGPWSNALRGHWPMPQRPDRVICRALWAQRIYMDLTRRAKALTAATRGEGGDVAVQAALNDLSSGPPKAGHACAFRQSPRRRSTAPEPREAAAS